MNKKISIILSTYNEKLGIKKTISELKPDIIIVSIAEGHLPLMGSLSPLEDVHRITHTQDGRERANPYRLRLYELEVRENFKTKLIFGPAAQTPFGIISDDQKRECGEIIKELL